MVRIPKKDVVEYYRMDVQAQLHVVKERIRFFKNKHGESFEDYEHKVMEDKKDFEFWDDYIEWKAYTQMLHELKQNLEDLRNEDIQLTG